ncbi:MurR/RpiR family transcriptional regulator [Mycoplasma sp. 'Moose RK']|uniref:MurR/RpiR family transcriptional regulator n=1 Tax=Mycoplasma sp. 'Moose RK' TaxID=2780095 RepID=UPI0018C2E666|nr:MurR/RpiR family transcriptional regulator [Mycoplasma sp. 'Moose RK']MBG0730836.1 MurR/RpiR family transcriptional regulator [Mycoplasma sp. 'Moose RK']
MSVLTISKNFKLTNIEKLIIRFIEAKPRKFIEQTINELAATLFISVGSITQLVKKLGFNNFKELKRFVIEWLRMDKENNLYDENDEIENVNLLYAHSIEKTMSLLEINQINRITDAIINAKNIITFGIGSSLMAASEMSNNLRNLHLNAFTAKSIYDIAAWVSQPNQTVVLVFSTLMSSKDLILMQKLVKQFQIQVVFITTNTKLETEGNTEIIYFDTLEQNKRTFSVGAKIAQLFIADLIAMKIQCKLDSSRTDFYNEFNRIWRKRK